MQAFSFKGGSLVGARQWADTWVGPYRLLAVQHRTRVISIIQRYVIASTFGFTSHSLRSGTSQAKLREASRSSIKRILFARNEILRHFVPQNDNK